MKLPSFFLLLALAAATTAGDESCFPADCQGELGALTSLLTLCYKSLDGFPSKPVHIEICFNSSCESQRLALLAMLSNCQANNPAPATHLPVTDSPTTTTALSSTESPWIHFNKTNAFYKFVKLLNFEEGKRHCAGLGGNLASIHSAEENKFIFDEGTKFQKDAIYGILGVQDRKWIDGSAWDYSNWARQQPDSSGPCAYMLFSPDGAFGPENLGKWDDSGCNWKGHFVVCKKFGEFKQ